jgi:hypothetical protein
MASGGQLGNQIAGQIGGSRAPHPSLAAAIHDVGLAVLRAELEAGMPGYRGAAPAISRLGVGLGDAGFAGGCCGPA